MYRSIVSCLVLLAGSSLAWSGHLDSVVSLPNHPLVSVIKYDAAGNLYVAGSVPAAHPRSQDDVDAFVAKLTGDGAGVLFWTVLSGSHADGVNALALDPDGSILAAGSITSSDFPVTENAAEKQNTTAAANTTGFFARLDPNGKVVYASYLNGAPSAQFVNPSGITTDASGAAYITGQGSFTSTSGALPAINSHGDAYFTVKLDTAGKQVFATGGIGGAFIVLDVQGFIYISGADSGQFAPCDAVCGWQKRVATRKRISSGPHAVPEDVFLQRR